MKLQLQQYYLQFEMIVANCFLECARWKQLFATFADSAPMFVFPMVVGKFCYQSVDRKSFKFPQVLIKILII